MVNLTNLPEEGFQSGWLLCVFVSSFSPGPDNSLKASVMQQVSWAISFLLSLISSFIHSHSFDALPPNLHRAVDLTETQAASHGLAFTQPVHRAWVGFFFGSDALEFAPIHVLAVKFGAKHQNFHLLKRTQTSNATKCWSASLQEKEGTRRRQWCELSDSSIKCWWVSSLKGSATYI